jgi:hypothetical protein
MLLLQTLKLVKHFPLLKLFILFDSVGVQYQIFMVHVWTIYVLCSDYYTYKKLRYCTFCMHCSCNSPP